VANEVFSLKSASVRWAGWATVAHGRVGKLKTRVGKRKFFSALRAEFCPPWPETLPAPLQCCEPYCEIYLFADNAKLVRHILRDSDNCFLQ